MKFYLLSLFLFISCISFSQNGGNHWYFGQNAGIDFSSGVAVATNDGQLVTQEGCSTISDDVTGDLLFYSDGITVYDALHNIMVNGTGLDGDFSSTQSAVIVNKPGSSNIYYIFTMDVGTFGLKYSEVDMTLNSGLGEVTAIKNIPLYANTAEKLSVVQHQNGVDYWVIIWDDNLSSFKTFLFTSAGVNPVAVNSTIPNGAVPGGYLKVTIDGSKLVTGTVPGARVYDFNNATGIVSDVSFIAIPGANFYGFEFSPNNQFLYAYFNFILCQFDLLAGSDLDILNSKIELSSVSSSPHTLQLGPDGRIYAVNYFENTLDVIVNPNMQGISCGFVANGFSLIGTGICRIGLPSFQNNINIPSNFSEQTICKEDSVTLLNFTLMNPNWVLQDNPSVVLSTDSLFTVSPTTTTTYIGFEGTDTIIRKITVVIPPIVQLGEDICNAIGTEQLELTHSYNNYLWSNDSTTSTIDVTETGVYWVEVTNGFCTARDSIFIQFEEISIESPVLVECDSVVSLLANDSNEISGYWTYLGPPGSIGLVNFSPDSVHKNPTVTVPVLGEYIFTYTSDCGNEVSQTIEFVSKEPVLEIETIVQCDFEIDLITNSPVIDGFWSVTNPSGESADIADINSATTTATVTGYGLYTFTFTYDFCEASFSQTVDIQSVTPTITTDTTLFVCELEMTLSADVLGHTEGWQVLRGPGILNFSNVAGENTLVTVSDNGEYEISFEGCGGSDTIIIRFEKSKPSITSPEYVDCGLQALIEVDYVGESGIWSVEPENDEILQFDCQDSTQAILTSDRYGSAIVKYTICDSSVSRRVVFMCELDIPNVFTPNNDAYNHSFVIPRLTPTYYSKSKFTVFNRWGVPVYTNGEYGLHNSWWKGNTNNGGGKQLSEGVYFYELNLYNKVKQREENYKGTVHLFR